MTTMTAPAPAETPPPVAPDPVALAPVGTTADAPRPLRWTREEYYRMAEVGLFRGRRVMLIEGEVFAMSPMNEPHTRGMIAALYALQAAFGDQFTVRPQVPLELGQASDPEPDLAVVAGSPKSQPRSQPTTAALVVEVADSSLAYDTGDKANLYAAAGIADYWVVDLNHDRLVVFRDPRPDPAAPHGHSYFLLIYRGPGDTVAPLAAPNDAVAVADLLP